MKKIVVFSGAGISLESGIDTFRDMKDGLWYNHNVEDVATASGFKKNPKLVFDFHNELRRGLHGKEPNSAHLDLKELEKDFDVTIITQNVDNLHEKAGSTKILHLHGELFKSRSSIDDTAIYDCQGDLNLGDLCEEGTQLRPHTVLFDEYPYNVPESVKALKQADVLLIIGTSLPISYTIGMLQSIKRSTPIYYIDPNPENLNGLFSTKVEYIKETATKGMKIFLENIKKRFGDTE